MRLFRMTAIVGQFVRIHTRSCRHCKANTHAQIHTDMLNKADYTRPMINVTSVEHSFFVFALFTMEYNALPQLQHPCTIWCSTWYAQSGSITDYICVWLVHDTLLLKLCHQDQFMCKTLNMVNKVSLLLIQKTLYLQCLVLQEFFKFPLSLLLHFRCKVSSWVAQNHNYWAKEPLKNAFDHI